MTAGGVDVYFWTVDDPAIASGLLDRGANGIISNDLTLLVGLPRAASLTSESGEQPTP
jgi:glycerophosphoryl diester phosphodiesterase